MQRPATRNIDLPCALRSRSALLLTLLCVLPAGCKLANPWTGTDSVARCRELSQEGLAAIERQDWTSAEARFDEAIKACPVDPEARRYYSEALWNRGDHHAALSQLHEAIRLAPSDPALHLRLAELALETGEFETAQREVNEALDLEPTLASAWTIRGRIMSQMGRLEQALADFHRALRYEPENFSALYGAAEAYRAMDRNDRALGALRQLVELFPPGEEPQDVLYLTGMSYLALNRYSEARGIFAQAMRRGPPSAELYARIAEAELMSGNTLAANQHVQAALEINPQHASARAVRERIALARNLRTSTPR